MQSPDDYLGRMIKIPRFAHLPNTVDLPARERQAITLAGISWYLVELDRSRNRVVLQSTQTSVRSVEPLDRFLRYVRSGDIVVE